MAASQMYSESQLRRKVGERLLRGYPAGTMWCSRSYRQIVLQNCFSTVSNREIAPRDHFCKDCIFPLRGTGRVNLAVAVDVLKTDLSRALST